MRRKIGIAILLLASVGGTCIYFYDLYSLITVVNWPEVNGKISSIEINERQYKSKGRLKTNYGPRIRYQYEVNGTNYVGGKVNYFDDGLGTKEYVDNYISPYREGMQVKVFYNSALPSESCLDRSMNKRSKMMAIFPLIILATIVIYSFRRSVTVQR